MFTVWKNYIKNISFILTSWIILAGWIILLMFLFQVNMPIQNMDSSSLFYSWTLSVQNFSFFQNIGMIILSSGIGLLIFTFGLEYTIITVEKINKYNLFIQILLFSLIIASVSIGLILIFINLV